MTKVTVEMVERVEEFAHMVALFGDPDMESDNSKRVIYNARHLYADDLRALAALCRRVIEPGEDVVERCARALHEARCKKMGWNAPWEDESEFFRKPAKEDARAVLTAIADPTAS